MENEIKRGEIYFVLDKPFTGSEQSGGRPAVIVSNNKNNKFSETVEVIYLTTAKKHQLPTHCNVLAKYPSTALCEQITTVSKNRLSNFIRECSFEEMSDIDFCMMISLGILNPVGKVVRL